MTPHDALGKSSANPAPSGINTNVQIKAEGTTGKAINTSSSSNAPSSSVVPMYPMSQLPIAPASFAMQSNPRINPLLKGQTFSSVMPSPAMVNPASFCFQEQHGQNGKLRSGKWIPEEEEYALLLVDLFEKGIIQDCENGATLRSYLSHKLRCAPMRISKKFAGKGIGKMIYTAKLKQPSPDMIKRLKDTEERFKKAINPTPPGFLVPGIPLPFLSPNFLSGYPAAAIPKTVMRFPTVPNVATPLAAPKPQVVQESPKPTPASTQPPATSVVDGHTKQLQVAYLKALQQVGAKPPTSLAPTVMPKAPIGAPPHAPVGSGPPVPLAAPPRLPLSSTATTRMPVQSTATQPATGEIPDILAGFDKLVQPPQTTATTTTTTANATTTIGIHAQEQYSPPFTSQSFDDFHRFLGKDLTLLNETTQSAEKDTSNTPAPDTGALFAADSYAIFSQESAIEPPPQTPSSSYLHQQQSDPKIHKELDVDGMLKLVSEQTYGYGLTDIPTVRSDDPLELVGSNIDAHNKRAHATTRYGLGTSSFLPTVSEPATEASADGGSSEDSDASDGPKLSKRVRLH